MEQLKLSKRLQAIADLIPAGSHVADIGTDHGYIPVWLAQQGRFGRLAAADINRGPLEHAKQTAAQYGVTGHIQFALCNGLQFDGCEQYNSVIIAGMGGELVMSIIGAATWTKNGTTLILQPNSKIAELVEWLNDNGYVIINTKLTKDAGKLYQILIATAGEEPSIPHEADRLVHPLYLQHLDPLLPEYLDTLLSRYRSAQRGMLSGAQEAPELQRIQNLISRLEAMKQEVTQWQL